jgi:ketosteroid isomerase-like protein
MAEENVSVVRRAYEAYAKGDLAAAGSAYSEDTVWDVTRFRPDEGVHRGMDELARYIGSWRDTWSAHDFALERVIDAGDRVVAVVRESGVGRSSGAPVTVRYGQVITVRDGKIVETVVYSEPRDAFEAAGLTTMEEEEGSTS